MRTYTYGRAPESVIRQLLPHKYPMELNKSDMLNLLHILKEVPEDSYIEWAIGMRQSILETIGIEEV
jgi:hypothetical protein